MSMMVWIYVTQDRIVVAKVHVMRLTSEQNSYHETRVTRGKEFGR